jgi:hypothetical protein
MGCQIARTVQYGTKHQAASSKQQAPSTKHQAPSTTAHPLTRSPAHPCRSFYVTCDTWTLPSRPQEPPQRALESGVCTLHSARAVWQPFIANSHGPLSSTLSRAAGFEVAATVQYSLHMLAPMARGTQEPQSQSRSPSPSPDPQECPRL